MAYSSRPLSSIVNKMSYYMYYKNTSGSWRSYNKTIDITVMTQGDLNIYNSLVLSFAFIVPDDFPQADTIQQISTIRIFLYHSEEYYYSDYFMQIYTDSMELLFGRKINPGENANITFIFPQLQYYVYFNE
jgi:hypothetical protein